MTAAAPQTTHVFQAEINQLLSLIINTFYSDKEVFVRELVSNASDAIDKFRHMSLSSGKAVDNDNFYIRLSYDKPSGILRIADNGIGMTKEELIKNLGTIAQSGTRQFMEALKSGKDNVSLIGQFGMGFYSAFLVAKSVRVVSRAHGSEEVSYWASEATGTFDVGVIDAATTPNDNPLGDAGHGTVIELFLKEEGHDYMEEGRLRAAIKKHCEFIAYPIMLQVERDVEVEEEEKAGEEVVEEKDGVVINDAADETDSAKKTVKRLEWDAVNKVKAIWVRNPDDVTADEYNAFYKTLSMDWDPPLQRKHFVTEGQYVFTGLLYFPSHPPYDMFQTAKKERPIKLYVSRVFITDDVDLLPEYLHFMRGVVDSDDLPLNISREMLQKSRVLDVIKKTLVKKAVEMIKDLVDSDPEAFEKFWSSFGKNIKWGAIEDKKNEKRLLELLRFNTSRSPQVPISLTKYVERMKDGQKGIYYIVGESQSAVENSAFLERLKKKGYEVLYMTEAIDEYLMQNIREFDGKPFVSVVRDGADLEEDADALKQLQEDNKEICERIKEVLGDQVSKVQVSNRIVDSPCVVVTDAFGWSANMERIMKAQALKAETPFGANRSTKIFEINPAHPLVEELKRRAETTPGTAAIKDVVNLLFQSALIASGFTLEDPSSFAKTLQSIVAVNLGVEAEDGASDPSTSPETATNELEQLD